MRKRDVLPIQRFHVERRVLLTISSLLLVCSNDAARAQPACSALSSYALLRQDEDYRYLRDPACRQDPCDQMKFIPLDSSSDRYLTIGGEIRDWYEGFHNANWGRGPQDGNGYLLQRLSLVSDWHVGSRFRFFGQLTSDIEAGRNGGVRPNDEARLWI
jgi:hypothetical protein